MANYTIPENPEYTTEIRKLENTDPANAETVFNPLVETLIQNTHAVKLQAEGKAEADHTHRAENINEGILPVARGGTGQSSLSGIRNALGLGNTIGVLSVENGGTGANNASSACVNLGALPILGGTITGNLRLKNSTNYGSKLNFGDGEYVYLHEVSDDILEIKAKKVFITPNNTTYTDPQLRNIIISTSDLTAGTSTLANGTLYFVYE